MIGSSRSCQFRTRNVSRRWTSRHLRTSVPRRESTNVARRGHGGYMDRSPEVEQLAVAWLAGMKAGDAVGVASPFVENEATTVIGNGADQWFTGDAYTKERLENSLGEHGGIPFEPGSPTGWAAGDTGWFADQVTLVFPAKTIPLRITAAVPVLAGEGVPVDLAPGEPGEAGSRAETGQRKPLGWLAGEQQGRVGLADQLRQLARNGQQRGAVRRNGGEHVAGLFD